MGWLNDYLQKISDEGKNKKLVIYGAGRVANIVLELCKDNDISIEGFCVTNLEENVAEIKGLPVWQFEQLRYHPEETLILIGVKERGKHKIKNILENADYKNYIETPENILDCEEFEREKKKRPVMEITPKIGCSVNCRYCPQQLLMDSYFKEGNVAECGVYRGEFAYYINKYFKERILYLFDTFEGFDKNDVSAELELNNYAFNSGSFAKGDLFKGTDEDIVMHRMPFPDRCVIKKGYFPNSVKGMEDTFCFVNLDMDLYKPMFSALEYFYDRMAGGGGGI